MVYSYLFLIVTLKNQTSREGYDVRTWHARNPISNKITVPTTEKKLN